VSYRQKFDLSRIAGRYVVAVPAWRGSTARVLVNGKEAGWLVSRPWEIDVTSEVKPGANEVEVIVIGTLKNTLGPHHGNNPLGTAWPRMFQTGPKSGLPPGADYATVGYGLFAPFELRQTRPANK
jgi:hypothetical protein